MQKTSLKLIAALKLANDVREFQFEGFYDFKPGQFFLLDVQDGKKPTVTRAYSVSNSPKNSKADNCLNFCVKLVPDGRGTGYLDKLKPGDEASWQGPFGHFTLDKAELGKPNNDIIFIATGAGLAPFMCMLEVLLEENSSEVLDSSQKKTGDKFITKEFSHKKKITLYFGVRNQDELFYEDRLAAWEEKYSNFKVVKTLSKPETNWTGKTGRVTEHLEKLDVLASTDVFICGNGHMVKDVKKMMEEKGLPREKIHFELFTPIT